MCKIKLRDEKNENKQINTVEENDDFEYLSIDQVEMKKNNWTDSVKINDMDVKIKLDTSVQLNVMPYKLFKKLKIPLKDSSVVIIKHLENLKLSY